MSRPSPRITLRGGATLPAGTTPDRINDKGLIAYNGIEKPAYATAQQQFARVPSFARRG